MITQLSQEQRELGPFKLHAHWKRFVVMWLPQKVNDVWQFQGAESEVGRSYNKPSERVLLDQISCLD